MPSHNTYHLTWFSLTLDMGYLFTANQAKHSCCSLPWTRGISSQPPLLTFATPWTLAYQPPLSVGFSGKNTGVGCHFLLQCMKVKSESEVAQLCPTRSDPMDCSPPGSSIHGIFQAKVPEWGAVAFSTHHLYVVSKKIYNELIYKTETRLTDIENKLTVTKGQDRWEG